MQDFKKIAVITPIKHLGLDKLIESKGEIFYLENGSRDEVRLLLIEKSIDTKSENKVIEKKDNKQDKQNKIFEEVVLDKTIIALFAKDDDEKTTKQFLNTYELGIYNLGISDVVIQIEFFENENDLKKIIEKNLIPGKIFLGPIQSKYAKFLDNYCADEVIFFSYSSKSSLAKDCVYLINFFPQNELSQLMLYLNDDAKVALLYPENEYGYLVNSFIDEINKQYTVTARSKGLSENKVLYSHVFKNAIIPILTGFPAQFVSAFFTGSILIETIFSLDGIGLLSYEAIIQRDYPVVMGTLFVFTLIGLLTKLITDIMYVYVDPRIKFTSSSTQRNQ